MIQNTVPIRDYYGQEDRHTDGRTNSIIPLQRKRALLWRFDVAGKKPNVLSLRVKLPVFLSNFNQIRTSTSFHKSYHHHILHKAVQHGPLYTCAQTCMTKVIGAFREYANSPKMATDLRVVKCNNLKIQHLSYNVRLQITFHS